MKTEHEVLVAVIENLTKLRQQMLIPNVARDLGICLYAIDGLRPPDQCVAFEMLKDEFERMGLDRVYPVTVDDAALVDEWRAYFSPDELADPDFTSLGEWLFESSGLPLWGDNPYGDARRVLLNRLIGNLVLSLQTYDASEN